MAGMGVEATDRGEAIRSGEEIRIFATVAGVVLGSRLPFLSHGYGIDPDGWRVAEAARQIAANHVYMASRRPGNPVQEIACALIRGGGPPALNGATAVMCAIAAGFFALSLRRLGRPEAVVAGLALAFTPVVYVNSVASMDYLWALGFLMASLYSLLGRRVVLAGVLAGLAVGCRLTSVLMLGPFSLFLLLEAAQPPGTRIVRALKLCGAAGATGLACFAPVLQRFGLTAFLHEANHPGAAEALKAATLETWGLIGLLALAAAAVTVAVDRARERRKAPSLRELAPWLSAIGVYLALYAALPNEAGYLIPAIPFVLLWLGALLPLRRFVALAGALAASSFFFGVGREATPGGPVTSRLAAPFTIHGHRLVLDPLQGPVLAAESARREAERYVARVIARGRSLQGGNVIVAGYWWTQVAATLYESPRQDEIEHVERLRPAELRRYQARGYSIHYLARQDTYNLYQGGVDLAAIKARELVLDGDAPAEGTR
jgi:hypothetical protein